jgi:hypothetical protein
MRARVCVCAVRTVEARAYMHMRPHARKRQTKDVEDEENETPSRGGWLGINWTPLLLLLVRGAHTVCASCVAYTASRYADNRGPDASLCSA